MTRQRATSRPTVLTIGHSTRTIDDFIELLHAHGVKLLVDIRTVPRSRHNPQFNKDALPASLADAKIHYQHVPGLGGLRHARADSPNQAWHNASFRGFADFMQTAEFENSLQSLIEVAARNRIAIMCAEALPWRCHRSLIADALLAHGVPVEHIMSGAKRQPHRLTPWAKVHGDRVLYPAESSAET